jgi:hypothetical protein
MRTCHIICNKPLQAFLKVKWKKLIEVKYLVHLLQSCMCCKDPYTSRTIDAENKN